MEKVVKVLLSFRAECDKVIIHVMNLIFTLLDTYPVHETLFILLFHTHTHTHIYD